MNYETLYEELIALEKNLKDTTNATTKQYKTSLKAVESGDIKTMEKTLTAMIEQTEKQRSAAKEMLNRLNNFDVKEYYENGDLGNQILEACKEQEVDVVGEYPNLEMFPYRVKIDATNQEVYMDKKKLPSIRPKTIVETIKAGQEKLKKANFNAGSFSSELAEAYDMAILKSGKNPGTDVFLTTIYKLMAPMARYRKDYDLQNFAYDIARLYEEKLNGMDTIKDGRGFQFGPSRKGGKAIRILDKEGKEEFLATISFFEM